MVYQSVGGLGIEGHGQGRFVKFGKKQQRKVDTSLVPNPIPDLYYDQSILILDANAGIVDLSPNNTVINNITGLTTVDNPVIVGSKSFDFTGERLEAQISMSATKWTIRTWAYFLSFSSYDTTVFEWNDYRYGLLFRMDSGTRLGMWVESSYYGVDPYSWTTNKWYHLEWCYDNGNHYVFVDGKLEKTFSVVADIPSSLGIGFSYHSGGVQRMNGYLQYFQVIQGVTAHTQDFDLAEVTPVNYSDKAYGLQYNPTVPLEAIGKRPVYSYGASGATITNIPDWNVSYQKPKARISYTYTRDYFDSEIDPHWSNVRLLIGGVSKTNNSQLIDESSFNHTLTLNTVTKNDNYSKFGNEPSIAMNNSTIVISSANFSSVSVFTYEMWVYHDPAVDNYYHFGFFSTSESSGRAQLYQLSGQIYTEVFGIGQAHTSPANSMPSTAGWVHVAICRDASNNYSYYVNGNRVSTVVFSSLLGNSSGFRVGGSNMSLNFDEVRFTLGVCRYSGTSFPIPTKKFYRG